MDFQEKAAMNVYIKYAISTQKSVFMRFLRK